MMIIIDGSQGEGGGQILRTALALSLVTGQSFRLQNIRAGRQKPGLLRQHLTAVEAAMQVGNATVDGAALSAKELTFNPGKVVPGDYRFSVGTAGSATLVLQTILPALLVGNIASTVTLEGGTHNPHAPPFDFLSRAFLPVINRMGPCITATLERAGFYPAGGGRFNVAIKPASRLEPFQLLERGESRLRSARAIVANLSRNVGDRELKVVSEKLGWPRESLQVEEVASAGPGNALILEIGSELITEVFTGFGERGVLAETVAEKVVGEVRGYLALRRAGGRTPGRPASCAIGPGPRRCFPRDGRHTPHDHEHSGDRKAPCRPLWDGIRPLRYPDLNRDRLIFQRAHMFKRLYLCSLRNLRLKVFIPELVLQFGLRLSLGHCSAVSVRIGRLRYFKTLW